MLIISLLRVVFQGHRRTSSYCNPLSYPLDVQPILVADSTNKSPIKFRLSSISGTFSVIFKPFFSFHTAYERQNAADG